MEKLIIALDKKLDAIILTQKTIIDKLGRLDKNISDVKYEVGSAKNDIKSEIRGVKSDISSINNTLNKLS